MKAITPNQDNLLVTDIKRKIWENFQTLGKSIIIPRNERTMIQDQTLISHDGHFLLAIEGRQINIWDLSTYTKKKHANCCK